MQTAIRIRQDTGEIFILARGRSGVFEFGNPAHGDKNHHVKNLVTRDSLAEAVQALRDGLHPRMRGQTSGHFNMISPSNIILIEVDT